MIFFQIYLAKKHSIDLFESIFIFGGHIYDTFIVNFTIITRIILTEVRNICHLIFSRAL